MEAAVITPMLALFRSDGNIVPARTSARIAGPGGRQPAGVPRKPEAAGIGHPGHLGPEGADPRLDPVQHGGTVPCARPRQGRRFSLRRVGGRLRQVRGTARRSMPACRTTTTASCLPRQSLASRRRKRSRPSRLSQMRCRPPAELTPVASAAAAPLPVSNSSGDRRTESVTLDAGRFRQDR